MYARVMKEKNKVDFNNEYKIRLGISKNKYSVKAVLYAIITYFI